jgi:general secretion pathway protein J
MRHARVLRPRGFTLVEMLLAISLMSLLLLATGAAFRGLAHTSTRLDQHSAASDELRMISGLLQRSLSAAVARPGMNKGSANVHFDGQAHTLSWVAPLPAREGIGGLSHLRLSVRTQPEQHALVLQIAPFANFTPSPVSGTTPHTGNSAIAPDWRVLAPRTLVATIDHFEIRYRGFGETQWQSHWRSAQALPAQVMLSVRSNGRDWPPLVIALADVSP